MSKTLSTKYYQENKEKLVEHRQKYRMRKNALLQLLETII